METNIKNINEITIDDLNEIVESQLLSGDVRILVLEKFHKNENGVYVARGYAQIYEHKEFSNSSHIYRPLKILPVKVEINGKNIIINIGVMRFYGDYDESSNN
jgi:hypothetical protein